MGEHQDEEGKKTAAKVEGCGSKEGQRTAKCVLLNTLRMCRKKKEREKEIARESE